MRRAQALLFSKRFERVRITNAVPLRPARTGLCSIESGSVSGAEARGIVERTGGVVKRAARRFLHHAQVASLAALTHHRVHAPADFGADALRRGLESSGVREGTGARRPFSVSVRADASAGGPARVL